ncbi:hypothetical protein G6F57_002990 [Rhizopus arrhizus]|uniref:Uncharacterized protein n=1 Tax=Rhizopus oryzae TaxID=64495 RepID=A0A9P7BVB4_RHIOR|nr:hypothetical protein G6F23_006704 [Rhizopus arrhizus]KAG1420630.1 hypothetical protein G6F58_004097 [Rhizopus delemar]KAG0767575.1 hypothetical protein G6F24_002661 [Rhizopus arrhizus]KAG0796091.1 hypothetical protein G6F21_001582 [Rhizopus arrhizus]KAG0802048.1 hypothetical protein G6F22_000644 [Rhizopus arrhizus]
MARAQMKYDLDVSVLNLDHLIKLKSCQNECIRRVFDHLTALCIGPNTKLLSARRPLITQYPILWLPMARCERSRVLR